MGAKTWKLTKRIENLLRIVKKAMERAILTMRERHRSTWIKTKAGVQVVNKQKWRWTGHLARMNDSRWTKRIIDGCPYNDRRNRERPDTRWRDDRKICRKNTTKNSSG